MSGHSKWHNIQKTKGAQDAKRAQAFTMTWARRELLLGSPEPPSFTATMISRAILVKAAERLASAAPLVF